MHACLDVHTCLYKCLKTFSITTCAHAWEYEIFHQPLKVAKLMFACLHAQRRLCKLPIFCWKLIYPYIHTFIDNVLDICICICMCICICICMCMCICICICICICMCMCICICICICISTCICLFRCICICICICSWLWVKCVYICIHTW